MGRLPVIAYPHSFVRTALGEPSDGGMTGLRLIGRVWRPVLTKNWLLAYFPGLGMVSPVKRGTISSRVARW